MYFKADSHYSCSRMYIGFEMFVVQVILFLSKFVFLITNFYMFSFLLPLKKEKNRQLFGVFGVPFVIALPTRSNREISKMAYWNKGKNMY